MTVRVNKPAFNIREKLSELTQSIGLKGRALMGATTAQEARDLVSAGRKNLIQNGDFRVNQRGESTYTTISGSIFDRWKFQKDLLSEYTHEVTQSSDAPDGFNNSLRLEVTTSESSLGASDDLCLTQHVEGQDCQALMAGTKSAKPFTLSFWVKSNKTGIYSVTSTVSGSPNKQFATTYTINQASTWEYKVVRIPPCPQTIVDNTSGNLSFRWIMNAGSNYTTASSGNMHEWDDYHSSIFAGGHEAQIMTDGDVWQLTGVQVEVGKNATEFEYRTYGEELALCQRYYVEDSTGGADAPLIYFFQYASSYRMLQIPFPVPMRSSNPTVVITMGSGADTTGLTQNYNTTEMQYKAYVNVSSTSATSSYIVGYTADAEL
tara:strand:- start:31 stop:1158 length:1128 start_codon:yes stop_codon:yes gene_type:complete